MLYLAADHRGFKLKNQLKSWLTSKKIPFKDLGAYQLKLDDDYPHYALTLSDKVLEDENNLGILFCGSGAGVCIAANKFKGIRCAIGFNHQQVQSFRKHDNVNVLAIAADYTNKFKLFQLVKAFINTDFLKEEKYLNRLQQIENIKTS
jgi:RpiB/LacA/LacB family sugar-phosphate isomerase